jgi:hypothetical protein
MAFGFRVIMVDNVSRVNWLNFSIRLAVNCAFMLTIYINIYTAFFFFAYLLVDKLFRTKSAILAAFYLSIFLYKCLLAILFS